MNKKLSFSDSGLTRNEYAILKKLNTPQKIQNFLNLLSYDFDPGDEIDRSVRGTLKSKKTDCAGGAVLAAAALWVSGRPPILLDLKTAKPDFDHVLTIFKEGKHFGAISKTNHAVLRYREPIYRSIRELAASYFHEYFLPDGRKTLRSFSNPLNLSKFGPKWLTDEDSLHDIMHALDHSKHTSILTKSQIKNLRKADLVERKAGEIAEY